MLRDVVGVCAVIFQQAENMLGALQANCTFKRKILHSLERDYKTWHSAHTQTDVKRCTYNTYIYMFSHSLSHSFPHRHTHKLLNTHIYPFDSVWKLQGLVESVDIDSVSWVFVHEWWLQGCVEKEHKLAHISLDSVSYECFPKIAGIGLSNTTAP